MFDKHILENATSLQRWRIFMCAGMLSTIALMMLSLLGRVTCAVVKKVWKNISFIARLAATVIYLPETTQQSLRAVQNKTLKPLPLFKFV